MTAINRKQQHLERAALVGMRALGLPDFETIELIASRQKSTIGQLTRQRIDDKLVRSLAGCQPSGCDRDTCSSSCWFALRRLRLELIPDAAQLFFMRGPVYTVAAIHPRYQCAVGDLSSVSVDGYRQWLTRRLRDLSRTSAHLIAFGSIEVTLNTELDGSSHWSPHAQLVVAGAKPEELKAALHPGKDFQTKPSETLVMIKPALCIGRALGYALKRKPEQRIAYIAKNDRTHRRKTRLPVKEFYEHEAWLAAQAIDDRLFLYGLRRHRQHLRLIENDEHG